MFNQDLLNTKINNDFKLYSELFKSYLTESELPEYKDVLVKTYTLVHELYEETNCLPLNSVYALRKQKKVDSITENEISSIVYTAFRKEIEKFYTSPLEEGTLEDIYESDMDKVFKIIVNTNTDLDPEISRKYSVFEKVIKDTISNVILPKDSLVDMSKYVNKLEPTYFEVFDRTVRDIKEELNEIIDTFAKNLAIKMFKKGIQFNKDYDKEDFGLEKYKGLSSLFKDKDPLDKILETLPAKVSEEEEDQSLDSMEIDNIVNK